MRRASSRSVLGSPRAAGSITVRCRGEAPPGQRGWMLRGTLCRLSLRPLGRQLLLAARPQHSLQKAHAGLLAMVPRGWNGARTTRGSLELPVPEHFVRQGRADVRAGLHPIPAPSLLTTGRLRHTESGKGTGAPADPRVLLLLGLGLSLLGSPQTTRTQWLPLTRYGHSLDGPGRRGSGGPRGGRHPRA